MEEEKLSYTTQLEINKTDQPKLSLLNKANGRRDILILFKCTKTWAHTVEGRTRGTSALLTNDTKLTNPKTTKRIANFLLRETVHKADLYTWIENGAGLRF
jgi:hypothetical protein